ncbi:MAG: ribosomal L7Ae/L30e/S12e/Gadd45 family protein [Clostridia bacterium]|nr:ribosomal L7Ae/L30e/S12e/Gadd45 family protein [Clostridia bacterium]
MHKMDGMIGLSVKAGKVVFGSEQAVMLLRTGRLPLIIIAEDASERTKKLIRDKSASFNGKWIAYGTVEALSRTTGKNRVAVLGIRDKGLAEAILKIYGGGTIGENNEAK